MTVINKSLYNLIKFCKQMINKIHKIKNWWIIQSVILDEQKQKDWMVESKWFES